MFCTLASSASDAAVHDAVNSEPRSGRSAFPLISIMPGLGYRQSIVRSSMSATIARNSGVSHGRPHRCLP
jgi:hypothetical protein